MTPREVLTYVQAQPFHPFVLHLADGRNLRVEHPEFLSISPAGRTIVVHTPDDSMQIVDLLLVVSLEPVNGSVRRRGRGRR